MRSTVRWKREGERERDRGRGEEEIVGGGRWTGTRPGAALTAWDALVPGAVYLLARPRKGPAADANKLLTSYCC